MFLNRSLRQSLDPSRTVAPHRGKTPREQRLSRLGLRCFGLPVLLPRPAYRQGLPWPNITTNTSPNPSTQGQHSMSRIFGLSWCFRFYIVWFCCTSVASQPTQTTCQAHLHKSAQTGRQTSCRVAALWILRSLAWPWGPSLLGSALQNLEPLRHRSKANTYRRKTDPFTKADPILRRMASSSLAFCTTSWQTKWSVLTIQATT